MSLKANVSTIDDFSGISLENVLVTKFLPVKRKTWEDVIEEINDAMYKLN